MASVPHAPAVETEHPRDDAKAAAPALTSVACTGPGDSILS